MTPRDHSPTGTWRLEGVGLDDATACLMEQVDQVSYPLNPDPINYVRIVRPGRVYEIVPEYWLLGGDTYTIRLTSADSQGVTVELYAWGIFKSSLTPAVERCVEAY